MCPTHSEQGPPEWRSSSHARAHWHWQWLPAPDDACEWWQTPQPPHTSEHSKTEACLAACAAGHQTKTQPEALEVAARSCSNPERRGAGLG
eukprot:1191536-Alexandrium_andersonii.AAC.1